MLPIVTRTVTLAATGASAGTWSAHLRKASLLDNPSLVAAALYSLPCLVVLRIYFWHRARAERSAAATMAGAREAGLTEPASLHPVVDTAVCMGSATCVRACPEAAIGIIGGKAVLVNPAACIGHGACAAACPVAAITLVFGTERRGVDIPLVKPDFETNVPGLYIAGELGGMGLIRKASEQGRQAMASIARRKPTGVPFDVVVVGAGPAGIAAGLGAIEHKLRYRIIEQESDLGGSVLHYPRQKIAMTAPVDLPIVGRVNFTEVSKEELLATWQEIVARSGLEITFNERMTRIAADNGGFRIETSQAVVNAGAVLLAIGRRGTPRKLDVPGEELPKVVYRLIEAAQYQGRRVLVVGGGDSAVEAAIACANEEGTKVTLAYRGDGFNRVKTANRQRIEAARDAGRVDVRLKTDVEGIFPDAVSLRCGNNTERIDNDAVIVQAGGVLPIGLLRDLGVSVETKYGTA
jgi:thioredoxin reductase (NADPH)